MQNINLGNIGPWGPRNEHGMNMNMNQAHEHADHYDHHVDLVFWCQKKKKLNMK